MPTYSRAELRTRILKDLGLVAANETPSADDAAWVEETISSEVAMLAALNMPIWNGSDMAVPLEYLTPLSRRIGLAVAVSYGLTDPATAQIAMRDAEATLALLSAPRGLSPLTLRSNDSIGQRSRVFNFSTGQ